MQQVNQQSLDKSNKLVAKDNLKFAFKLNQKLQKEQNVFFSPFNISAALALVYLGASQETKQQIKNTLQQTLTDEEIHYSFSAFQKLLNENQSGVITSTTNKAYIKQGINIQENYVKNLQEFYNTQLGVLDSAYQINKWVEDQTNNKIKNLLSEDCINELTQLILVSAIYFKGDWEKKFEEYSTKKELFYGENGQNFSVDMMFQESQFNLQEYQDFQALELPYQGGQFSMVILLPRKGLNFNDFIQNNLSLQTLEDINKEFKYDFQRDVEVYLPKFKLEFQTGLSGLLQELGMIDAFDETKADFSKITGKKDLYISDAIHKAFIEVNEKGSEAAAATAMVFECNCISEPEPVPVFRADRSFMYYIREKEHGNILFMGNYQGQE